MLRSAIDTARLDAYSDAPWPPEVLPSCERLLILARQAPADGSGMAIDVDVRDDEQFGLLLDLVPYTIHAEAWRGDREVFSASDSGTSLWLAVTREQEVQLRARLGELGIPAAVLAAAPRRRSRRSRRSGGRLRRRGR